MTAIKNRLLWSLFALSSGAILLGQLGRVSQEWDSLNLLLHFWVAIGLVALVALTLQRDVRRKAALALAAGAAILIVGAAGIGAPSFASADGAPGETLKVIAFNLWEENRSPRAAAEWILAERPDIVALIEAKGGAA